MVLPPALQQPAPTPTPTPASPGALARLLQTRGAVVTQTRKSLGILYGQGSVEVAKLAASDGTLSAAGLGLTITGPAPRDGEGRALLETADLPGLLAALDRYAAEAPKLAAGDTDTAFTYTAPGGLQLELAKDRDGVALTLRAGRGEARLATTQIAALKQLLEKGK
ncbi:MAG TPA: hypothetical protein VFT46_03200 [Holophagaceae bacterium]|nr:hypothetical protein [Holophagaceae bacterium]